MEKIEISRDEMIERISNALNDSGFWIKLKENTTVDENIFDSFSHRLEEYILNSIEDNLLSFKFCISEDWF